MKSTCSIREPEKAEIKNEDVEVLEDVSKEPAENSEEALKKILVQEGDEERFFLLGSGLAEEEEKELEAFLRANIEVFAWTPYEMPGIDPEVTCHKLNVDRSPKPVIQRARRPTLMHVEVVEEEVDRLLEARAIREVNYLTWLSNTVVVKKKNGKWRVCVDFTSLNKACPIDSFSLPKIDQLVDTTSGHGMMSFLDAYRGYHQIAMHPPNEEKTAGLGDLKCRSYLHSDVSAAANHNAIPQILGASFRHFIHSSSHKEFETARNSRSMNFVRGIIEEEGKGVMGSSQLSRYVVENNADIVHIKLLCNNTFVTVTDSKGNKKIGASSGCLSEMKGGPKLSRYAAEATAEHVGRLARNLGLKSVIMKVNGFTYFKKK
ncbi:unnamed protein product [Camellia sinensis]